MRASNDHGASIAVVRSGGRFLAVSRRADTADFGFPGGKREPGETFEACCLRELKEETGYDGIIVGHVYTGEAGGRRCAAFEVRIVGVGERRAEESGDVRWVEKSTLLRGTFRGFNREVLQEDDDE